MNASINDGQDFDPLTYLADHCSYYSGKTISDVHLISEGFANYVYSYNSDNETHFLKKYPKYFRSNNTVLKPKNSLIRERYAYDFFSRSADEYFPQVLFSDVEAQVMVTREFGQGSVNSLSQLFLSQAVSEELISSVLDAVLQTLRASNASAPDKIFFEHLSKFSEEQERYLIESPLKFIHVTDAEKEMFLLKYKKHSKKVVLGDVSAKNILVSNTIGFCDLESVFLAPFVFDIAYICADLIRLTNGQISVDFFMQWLHGLQFAHDQERDDLTELFPSLLAVCLSYRYHSAITKEAQSVNTRQQSNPWLDIEMLFRSGL